MGRTFDWKKFIGHDASPLEQFIKYALVGGVATATHVSIFYLCGWLVFPCLTPDDIVVRLLGMTVPAMSDATRVWNAGYCNAAGFVISNTVCYLLNRRFVFVPGRHHVVVESLLFFAVSGLSILIGTVVQSYLIAGWGLQTTLAFGANLVASLLINYAMRRFVIFKS